jgi:putative addiction module component (TIGR02574 family)
MNAHEILDAALALPEEDRWEVLERLLGSVDPGDARLTSAEWEAAWLPEIERRIEEIESGAAELLPAEDVFSDLRRKYARRA